MTPENTLIYDHASKRLAIWNAADGTLDTLHCGDVIEVNVSDTWTDTRVEANERGDWYLVGLYHAGEIPATLAVRR